jgi:hypothetical protein
MQDAAVMSIDLLSMSSEGRANQDFDQQQESSLT